MGDSQSVFLVLLLGWSWHRHIQTHVGRLNERLSGSAGQQGTCRPVRSSSSFVRRSFVYLIEMDPDDGWIPDAILSPYGLIRCDVSCILWGALGRPVRPLLLIDWTLVTSDGVAMSKTPDRQPPESSGTLMVPMMSLPHEINNSRVWGRGNHQRGSGRMSGSDVPECGGGEGELRP